MTVHETSLDEKAEPQPIDLRALGELAALQGVVKFPVRIKCATLAWNTLSQGLDELN
jgi:nitrogen fixation NifU-like protein